MMNDVVSFLQENPVQYLATVGRDGRAKCRPFMFCFERDGKLWFCTNHTKEVYKDLMHNPYVQISVSSPSYAWIRLDGKAVFADNRAVKEGCMRSRPGRPNSPGPITSRPGGCCTPSVPSCAAP